MGRSCDHRQRPGTRPQATGRLAPGAGGRRKSPPWSLRGSSARHTWTSAQRHWLTSGLQSCRNQCALF